jgi:membrane protein DedA with SNARE-associated domain
MVSFFSHVIGSASGSIILLMLAVMLCAFLLEDAATIIVGVLAADGTISISTALIALYGGILIGDLLLYALGSLARTHPRLAHYADHEFTAPFRDWLESRYTTIIVSGHLVPGLRLATYTASGFFRFPFSKYIPLAMLSGLVFETVLFTLSYLFGSVSATWVSGVRWGVAGVLILLLLVIARRNILSYRARKIA